VHGEPLLSGVAELPMTGWLIDESARASLRSSRAATRTEARAITASTGRSPSRASCSSTRSTRHRRVFIRRDRHSTSYHLLCDIRTTFIVAKLTKLRNTSAHRSRWLAELPPTRRCSRILRLPSTIGQERRRTRAPLSGNRTEFCRSVRIPDGRDLVARSFRMAPGLCAWHAACSGSSEPHKDTRLEA